MKGRLIDLALGMNGRQRITVEVDSDFQEEYQKLKDVQDLDIDIKKHFEKRGKTANAYLHVLINKLAVAKNVSESEIKTALVLEYGALAKDEDGNNIGFKLPAKTDVSLLWPYAKCFNQREENGTVFNFYLVYKRTHEMDTKEMARLIDGAVWEAKEYGIDTDPPDVLERYKEEWSKCK